MAIDVTTPLGQVRYLIGDTDEAALILPDNVINQFLLMVNQSVKLAAAQSLEAIANLAANNLTNITLGSLRIDETSKVQALRQAAQMLRSLEYDEPAFAVAEENLSQFNELQIIRNYILRTEV